MITEQMYMARVGLPLESKEEMSITRIIQAVKRYGISGVYAAVSGADSVVLSDLVDRAVKKMLKRGQVELVFSDTGLEFPEIRDFRDNNRTTVVKPVVSFKQVIEKYGLPLVGKKTADKIEKLSKPTERNFFTQRAIATGINSKGKLTPSAKLPLKWRFLVFEDVKISEKCCSKLKKDPMRKLKKVPIMGTMADESEARASSYKKNGCNFFTGKEPQSRPLSFWTKADIIAYIEKYNLEFPKCYGEIKCGKFTGEQRTGCVFCGFGAHLEQRETGVSRFERLKETHPKLWKYCIYTLGMGKWLGMCGVRTGDIEHDKFYDSEKIKFYAKMSDQDFLDLVRSRDKSKMHPRSIGYEY